MYNFMQFAYVKSELHKLIENAKVNRKQVSVIDSTFAYYNDIEYHLGQKQSLIQNAPDKNLPLLLPKSSALISKDLELIQKKKGITIVGSGYDAIKEAVDNILLNPTKNLINENKPIKKPDNY